MKLAIMKTNLVIVLAIFVCGCNNKSPNSNSKIRQYNHHPRYNTKISNEAILAGFSF